MSELYDTAKNPQARLLSDSWTLIICLTTHGINVGQVIRALWLYIQQLSCVVYFKQLGKLLSFMALCQTVG